MGAGWQYINDGHHPPASLQRASLYDSLGGGGGRGPGPVAQRAGDGGISRLKEEPFEEGILHLRRRGGWVPPCWVGGEEGGFENTVRGVQPGRVPVTAGE